MINYKTFNNYDEFKSLFPITKYGESASRQNKILLSLYKSGRWIFKSNLINVKDMAQLETEILNEIQVSGASDDNLLYEMNLNGYTFWSSQYKTDSKNGICEDGTIEYIRYYNIESDRIFKMKAGKMIRSLILETKVGKHLPPECINYICEQFVMRWKSYVSANAPKVKLFVNKDFKHIYDPHYLVGDFGSCMVGRERHEFYENAVDAKAAYLENSDGKIVARAIIFNKAVDIDNGDTYRLCERQYSSNGDNVYKQMLVNALYEGNFIDGHKTVGASCHDGRLFVDSKGNSLSDRTLYIECNLEIEDVLSYMDSFKAYNYDQKRAYNSYEESYDYDLATTDYSLDDEYGPDSCWDSYHERNCRETTTVYYHGSEFECDSDDMDEFYWVEREGEYHHQDDVCEPVDSVYDHELTSRCQYSNILEEWYYNPKNLEDAERKFNAKNEENEAA